MVEDCLDFDFTSAVLIIHFLGLFTLLPSSVSGGEGGLLFFFSLFPQYSIRSRGTVRAVSRLR